MSSLVSCKWLAVAAAALVVNPPASMALETPSSTPAKEVVTESTMPPSYTEVLKPELAAQYRFSADGEFTKASGLPTYEWMPVGQEPRAIIVGIHGLTLHGRRYRVLARALAVKNAGFVSMDMRGFGRCKWDPKKQFSTPSDDRTRVDHEKSYEDIVKLVTAVRNKYPGQRLLLMGESLGCTFAVRLAGEHKNLVDGIILSAPAVKVNPDMYIGHGNVARGIKAVVAPGHNINLNSFIKNLVSPRPDVVAEMLDDPMITKELSLRALLSTDLFVDKTATWGKAVATHLPVLIIQGSVDNCVSAKHVTDLTNNMPSDDQTIAWRGNYGHLQLETIFLRASVMNAFVNWMYDHSVDMQSRLDAAQQTIDDLGGRLSN